MKIRSFASLTAVLWLALAPAAFALTGTWNGGASATWDTTATNWSGVSGTPWDSANGSGNLATFNTLGATPVVSGTVFTNGITFGDTASISGGTITLAGAAVVTVNAAASIASDLAGSSGLTKAGTSTLTLSGSNGYTGTTTIQNGGGTLRLESLGSLGSGSVTIATAGTNTGTLELALTGTNVITNTFNGFSSANALTDTVSPGHAQILNTSGTNTINSNLDIANTGGNGLNIVSNGGLLTLAGTITTDENFRVLSLGGSGSGVVSGVITQLTSGDAMNVNKTGSSTWIFTNNSNNYNRRLSIWDGVIQVGDGGTTGALSAGQDVVFDATATAAAKLVFNRSDSYSYGSASAEISGPGSVEQIGVGTTTLSGINIYTGNTTVRSGNLTVSGAGRLANTGNVIINGGSLLVASSNAINTLAGVTMNGGNLTMAIATEGGNQTLGALTLSANSTLDFSSASANTLTFSGINSPGTNIFNIINWTVGMDHLYFTSNNSLSATTFTVNGGAANLTDLQPGLGYEIIAIPEPGTILAGALLLGGLVVFERRRLAKLLGGLKAPSHPVGRL